MIQSKPSEKGEIITYLSRMGDVLHNISEWCEFVVTLYRIDIIIYSNEVNIIFRKINFSIITDHKIVTT